MPMAMREDESATDEDEPTDRHIEGEPVLTDRHGFVLKTGNTVTKIADNTRFVVTNWGRFEHRPIVWELDDGSGATVDASLVMIDEGEQGERATYCVRCFNHFKETFEYATGCGKCT
jgi:hypothetical protein